MIVTRRNYKEDGLVLNGEFRIADRVFFASVTFCSPGFIFRMGCELEVPIADLKENEGVVSLLKLSQAPLSYLALTEQLLADLRENEVDRT